MSISIAIVGAGRMGKAHASSLGAIEDVRITGVADVRLDAATSLAETAGAKPFDDYREMLMQLKPDAVYLCTPAGDHLEQVTFAAEAGINIFVEKPISAKITDAFAIADVVERAGILCTTGYQWRYNPATDAAREALGDLPPSLFSGWWYWTIPVIPWIADRRFGGGQIFDQCTHLIDLMRYFGRNISSVYAAYSKNARSEAEMPNWDSYSVTLSLDSGGVGSVQSSYATFPGIPDSNGLDMIARELLVRINLGKVTVFRRGEDPIVTTAPDGWSIDQAFTDAVRTNDPELIRSTAPDAAHTVAISLASNYSAVTGQVVQLDQFIANPPPADEIMPNAQPVFQSR